MSFRLKRKYRQFEILGGGGWGGGELTYCGLVTPVVSGSVDGLSSVRHRAIAWTNEDHLSIEPLGTNFSEI